MPYILREILPKQKLLYSDQRANACSAPAPRLKNCRLLKIKKPVQNSSAALPMSSTKCASAPSSSSAAYRVNAQAAVYGLAAAVDYAIAAEGAEIKLSELAIGIGPFVVGPAVERKIGTSSYSQLAIDATMWRNADWARRKGLYSELHPSIPEMDESINRLAFTLSHSNPAAMRELKKVLWKGTEHWTNY